MKVYEKYYNRFGDIDFCSAGNSNTVVALDNYEIEEVYRGYVTEESEDNKEYLDFIMYLALLRRCFVWIPHYSKMCKYSVYEDLMQESYLTYVKVKGLSNTLEELQRKFFGKLREESSKFVFEKSADLKLTRLAKKKISDVYDRLYTKFISNTHDYGTLNEDALHILDIAERELTEKEYITYIMYSGILGKTDNKDIAEVLGCTTANVSTIMKRVREKLETKLK